MKSPRQLVGIREGEPLAAALRRGWDWINKLDFMQFGVRRAVLPWRVRVLGSGRPPQAARARIAAVTVVRNGSPWISSYLAHHREIGIEEFVILDNGSTDDTVRQLMEQPDVTLLASSVPYSAYENTMKRYLANTYCRGRWCLFVDIDELFDYPLRDRVSLDELIAYLDQTGANAVVTQMLDMFSDQPIRSINERELLDLKSTYRYYDLSNIDKRPYEYAPSSSSFKMHFGGIRKDIFGTNNGLTKISLFKMDGALTPFVQWHHARGASLADISCVLLHFPFTASFFAKVEDAVATGRYGHLTGDEYRGYAAALRSQPNLSMHRSTAQRLDNTDALIDQSFLVVSDRYRARAGEAA